MEKSGKRHCFLKGLGPCVKPCGHNCDIVETSRYQAWRNLSSASFIILLSGLGAVLVVLAFIATELSRAYDRSIAEAEAGTGRAAAAAEREIASYLTWIVGSVGTDADSVAALAPGPSIAGPSRRSSITDARPAKTGPDRPIRAAFLLDHDGRLLAGSGDPDMFGRPHTEMPYFTGFAETPTASTGWRIDRMSANGGRPDEPHLVLSRTVAAPESQAARLIGVVVPRSAMDGRLASIEAAAGASLRMILDDARPLGRDTENDVDALITSEADTLVNHASRESAGSILTAPHTGFDPSVVSYRASDAFGFITAAVVSVDDVTAGWHGQAIRYGAAATILVLIFIALTGFAMRQINQRDAKDIELRKNEKRFRDFADATSDWFWEQDSELRFTFMGEAIYRLTGRRPQDFIGRRRDEMGYRGVSPDQWKRHLACLHDHLPFRDFRFQVFDIEGRRRYLSISGKPWFTEDGAFGGYRGTGRDVTTEVEADARARTLHNRVMDVLESMPHAVALFGADDRLILYNRHCERLFAPSRRLFAERITFEEMTACALAHGLIGGNEVARAAWLEKRRAMHANPPSVWEFQLNDGRWLRVQEHRTADEGTLTIWTDISETKQRERELRFAKDEADRANRAKTDFLAHVSHELRTPLNAIIGFSDTILGAVFGPVGNTRYEGYVRDINASGHHLLQIINDILDLSKVEAGRFELTETVIDLTSLAEEPFRMMVDQADERGISMSLRLPPAPIHLTADRRAVKQIMLNLLSNAVKFTPEGGQVTLALGLDAAGQVELRVSDTGCGISSKDISRALEPFVQLTDPFNRQEDGTGLGLPLVKSLSALHGADVVIDSTPGTGTTVTVTFPAERVAARPGGLLSPVGQA